MYEVVQNRMSALRIYRRPAVGNRTRSCNMAKIGTKLKKERKKIQKMTWRYYTAPTGRHQGFFVCVYVLVFVRMFAYSIRVDQAEVSKKPK